MHTCTHQHARRGDQGGPSLLPSFSFDACAHAHIHSCKCMLASTKSAQITHVRRRLDQGREGHTITRTRTRTNAHLQRRSDTARTRRLRDLAPSFRPSFPSSIPPSPFAPPLPPSLHASLSLCPSSSSLPSSFPSLPCFRRKLHAHAHTGAAVSRSQLEGVPGRGRATRLRNVYQYLGICMHNDLLEYLRNPLPPLFLTNALTRVYEIMIVYDMTLPLDHVWEVILLRITFRCTAHIRACTAHSNTTNHTNTYASITQVQRRSDMATTNSPRVIL